MIQDQKGMEIDKVKINDIKLESYITSEKKLESILNDISLKVYDAYSSNNSFTLNNNNKSIVESTHIKIRNLESYKSYIEKYMNKYYNTGINAIDTIANMNDKFE